MPRALRPVLFLSIFSLFLFVVNLVVFEGLAVMLRITSAEASLLLGTALAALSGSFILASFLGMHFYNAATRLLYRISAVWMGLFVYLFLSTVTLALVYVFVHTIHPSIGYVLLLSAVMTAVYGYLHAQTIRITKVQLELPKVPEVWRGKRAIWTSDIHLGQVYGPSFTRKLVNLINGTPHDMVFLGGDVYDGTGAPDIEELARPFGTCKAPWGVYFVSGNHEEYGDHARFLAAIRAAGVRVLIDEKIDIEGVQIVGVDYHNASSAEKFAAILNSCALDTTKPTVLLKHEPVDLDVAHAAGVNLQISGHTHNGQLWPFTYIANLVHRGYAYGLKKFNDMYVFVSSGTGTWGPPMRVGTHCEIVVFTFL